MSLWAPIQANFLGYDKEKQLGDFKNPYVLFNKAFWI